MPDDGVEFDVGSAQSQQIRVESRTVLGAARHHAVPRACCCPNKFLPVGAALPLHEITPPPAQEQLLALDRPGTRTR